MAGLKPKGIVIHLSASKWGDREDIKQWHLAKGWNDIGYHGVICNGHMDYKVPYNKDHDGHIQPGRPEGTKGAHCQAAGMNNYTLGVCCIGTPGFLPEKAHPAPSNVTIYPYLTERQYLALLHWIRANCTQYGIDPQGTFYNATLKRHVHTISQHSDWDPGKPLCASLDMRELRKAI